MRERERKREGETGHSHVWPSKEKRAKATEKQHKNGAKRCRLRPFALAGRQRIWKGGRESNTKKRNNNRRRGSVSVSVRGMRNGDENERKHC